MSTCNTLLMYPRLFRIGHTVLRLCLLSPSRSSQCLRQVRPCAADHLKSLVQTLFSLTPQVVFIVYLPTCESGSVMIDAVVHEWFRVSN